MRVVFMGSPDFAVPSLEALLARHEVAMVLTQPDKPAGRGGHLTPPPVKVVAARAGVRVEQPASAKKPEVAEMLRATGAELAVVVAYGKILPRAVLEAFPRGCLNVHGSLLPRWRGAAPIQRAVMAGDRETGVCIMLLDEGMDTGPVLLERRLPIGDDDTAGTLFDKLAPLGAAALIEAIDQLDTLTPRAQPAEGATHAAMLKKEDGAVRFDRPAREVACLVRGVDPWPGATASLRGQVVKLFGARVADGHAPPGTVLAVDRDGARVACGDGAVVLAELQLPGRKRVRALDAANGKQLAPGDVLG